MDNASVDSKVKIKCGVVAVDANYFWLEMDTCPRGVKVQLLGPDGVACYGTYKGDENWATGWAPLPSVRKPPRVAFKE